MGGKSRKGGMTGAYVKQLAEKAKAEATNKQQSSQSGGGAAKQEEK